MRNMPFNNHDKGSPAKLSRLASILIIGLVLAARAATSTANGQPPGPSHIVKSNSYLKHAIVGIGVGVETAIYYGLNFGHRHECLDDNDGGQCPVNRAERHNEGQLKGAQSHSINSHQHTAKNNNNEQALHNEKTLILVKPDAVRRHLIGAIISRFESNFTLTRIKIISPSTELIKKHYEQLRDRNFFDELVKSMSSGMVVAMVWEGKNVIQESRTLIGATNPRQAKPGTIRHEYGLSVTKNVVHGSDSLESAEKEIKIWFGE